MRIEKDQMVTTGVVVALVAVFVLALWMPARAHRARMDREIGAARQTLGINAVDPQKLTQWHTQVQDLTDQVSGAQQYVPEHDELGEVLRGLTEALKNHGVTEQEIVTRETRHFAHYSVIPASIEFYASFPTVFGTLGHMEKMPRLIRVDRLSIQADPESPSEPMEVQIQLSTFYSQSAGGA